MERIKIDVNSVDNQKIKREFVNREVVSAATYPGNSSSLSHMAVVEGLLTNFSEKDQEDVFEYYTVSAFLAKHLKEQGEIVEKAWGSLNIWGRTTYGQAIMLDSVISTICLKLHMLR